MIGRPFQWPICLLHCNELSPIGWVNCWTKCFSSLHWKEPCWASIKLERILNSILFVILIFLCCLLTFTIRPYSFDHYCSYRICYAVILGEADEDLQLLEVGELCHFRWLTSACRIPRRYDLACNPSESQQTMEKFSIKVYLPSWFEIKKNETISDDSINYFKMMRRIANFPHQTIKTVGISTMH